MKRGSRTLTGIVSATVALSVLAAAPASAEKVMRWTSQGDALTLDPHSQNEGPTIAINGIVYESLVTRDPALKLEPELAESWKIEDNGWVFKLRKGVKFHDGADFTAEDVVFSFKRAMHKASDFKKQVQGIEEVKVIDDHTIKLVTKGTNPILPNQLTSLFIMDSGWAKANKVEAPQDFAAKEETFAVRNANGTGPFKLVSRAPDEKTVFVANAKWWGKGKFPGNIDKIEYRPIANAATRVAALLSREVDFVLDPSVQDIKRLKSTDGLQVVSTAQNRAIFFGLDQGAAELRSSNIKGKNPFADVNVRMAMNLAIDRKAIQRVIMDGLSVPAGMITSPGVLGNTPELDKPYGFDLAKAKDLMKKAGYADGFSVQLDCPNNRYINDEKICQAAVSMLAKIGIKVKLEAIPKAQHFPKIQKRVTDFYMLGWGVPTLDSHYVFSYLLDKDGSWNATGYNNAKVNEVTKVIATEPDIPKRTKMIDDAWKQVRADAPYIPMHHQVLAWGMSKNVTMPISRDDAFRPRFYVMK
ncbi:MAG: ABC transporter substrate-binding protein [Hyphomicrobiaceae bacterium]